MLQALHAEMDERSPEAPQEAQEETKPASRRRLRYSPLISTRSETPAAEPERSPNAKREPLRHPNLRKPAEKRGAGERPAARCRTAPSSTRKGRAWPGRTNEAGRPTAAPVSPGEAPTTVAQSGEAPAAPPPATRRRRSIPVAPPRPPKGAVILAIGLPGSGKSSWFKRNNITPLSSDMLRMLLFDDAQEQRFQDLVFSNLRSMLKARLIARRPLNYVDATNLTPHERAQLDQAGEGLRLRSAGGILRCSSRSLPGTQPPTGTNRR